MNKMLKPDELDLLADLLENTEDMPKNMSRPEYVSKAAPLSSSEMDDIARSLGDPKPKIAPRSEALKNIKNSKAGWLDDFVKSLKGYGDDALKAVKNIGVDDVMRTGGNLAKGLVRAAPQMLATYSGEVNPNSPEEEEMYQEALRAQREKQKR